MKLREWARWPAALAAAALFSAFGLARQIIENPEKPLAKNAGRVLKLEEVWRITDESGKFFFTSPQNLQTAASGDFFVADKEQLLKFSKEGKFVKNLFIKGQGPGEISGGFTYRCYQNEIYIQDLRGRRIFRLDSNGKYIDQLVNNTGRFIMLAVKADGFIGMTRTWPKQTERTGKFLPVFETIKLLSRDGSMAKDLHMFDYREFMTPTASDSRDPNINVLSADAKLLFGAHSAEYLIEILDLDKGTILKRFNRKYQRTKHVTGPAGAEYNRKFGIPELDYERDIFNLMVNGNKLWVWTSTKPWSRQSWDVFDFDGRYLDHFFIEKRGVILGVMKDEIFISELSADGTIVLTKYRITV